MQEDLDAIRKELETNEEIPLHLKFAEVSPKIIYGSNVAADRIKKMKSDKLQTKNYFVQPFMKHISQF